MDGIITEDYGVSLRFAATEGMSSEQHSISGDSIADWRSSEQVENGTASTSLPYWDIDDDDDCGPKPLDLYGRFTWKIEKFSTINKKELRSNAFEVGGYKWYILIYPQGCDVCNHLSLFLCVANHEQLMPGWSHFAQFTIAVVNKDPKKSKYSDTLHRFWKKEHDWGWKKFMELSKIHDGFIFSDTLIIKAQVQVIREKTNRPFRCLDIQYRRELVRVYASSVEQIFRRFLEERIAKLRKFIEDILRWHSFCAFWLGIDANARRRMSRDKTDAILKVVVKHFFIEKEVTSTLVMDSLYSGLKSLEYQSKNMKGTAKLGESEELPAPMVHIDQDLFVLADDIIILIERVVSDSLSQQPLPSKDDKYSQNRAKDGSAGDEFIKESVERDERRLLELGRRTIEMFVLVQMFSSRIEVSYQEVVALKRQEELIREEEVACQAQLKRGSSERERRSKKKQAKQKRNGRKAKDRGKDEDCNPRKEKFQLECQSEDRILDSFPSDQVELAGEKIFTHEAASDVYDAADDVVEVVQPDIDETGFCPSISDTDTSEIHPVIEINGVDVQNGQIDKRSQSLIADSPLTWSTESVLSALDRVSYNGSTLPNNKKIQYSRSRRKNKRDIEKECIDSTNGVDNQRAKNISDGSSHDINGKKASETEPDSTVSSMSEEQRPEKNMAEKEDVAILQKRSTSKDLADADRLPSSPSLIRKTPAILLQRKQSLATTSSVTAAAAAIKPASNKKLSSNIAQADNVIPITSRSTTTSSIHSEAQKNNIPGKISSSLQANATSRPSSAPLIPALRPTASITTTQQAVPVLSRSVSSAGRLGTAPSASAPSNVPQSYKNAIIGKMANASSSQSVACSQSPSEFASSASTLPQTPSRNEHMPSQSGLTFGCLNPDVVTSLHPYRDNHYEFATSTTSSSSSTYNSQSFGSLVGNMEKLNLYGNPNTQYPDAIGSRVCPQPQDTVVEEFPHLDIINDLLNEDENIGRTDMSSSHIFSQHYSLPVNYSNGETRLLVSANRFGQSENHYGEGLQRGYDGASSNLLHRIRDEHFHQMDHSSYANNMFDRSMQKQLPYRNTDPLIFNLTNGDANGYAHQLPYYMARGGNGFLYRPNGP
ncbi:TNF receptor-associated factor homolog 1a-like isoform X1 [Zingiber officinale]|uniref:TNF receptor-associated factor homolog 1a-like isoform X1 n=1 Tax=Zingiber officinale TaxID=94328 RepID=UPI001C4D8A87|nr:TNF receptor-associated factor homolog 1a-like isoform X1 [Zingiber officinale]XP_042453302.1 TNF receptor-associated factor homolog 1a-like isoform X1 [Zingiber officinale]